MGEAGVFLQVRAPLPDGFLLMNSTKRLFINNRAECRCGYCADFYYSLAGHYGWRSAFFVRHDRFVWVGVCYAWFKNHPAQMKGVSEKEREYIEAIAGSWHILISCN